MLLSYCSWLCGKSDFCFICGTNSNVENILVLWRGCKIIGFWAIKYFTEVLNPSLCLFALCCDVVVVLIFNRGRLVVIIATRVAS